MARNSVSFSDPEIVKGSFFVREQRFDENAQKFVFIVSPTDPAAKDQQYTLNILPDEMVDARGLGKLLAGNVEDIVELGLVRNKGSSEVYAYTGREMRKDRTVMGVDDDGRKRAAFNWTEGVDDIVDKLHGYDAKRVAQRELSDLARDGSASQHLFAAARDCAKAELRRLEPSMKEEQVEEWLTKNFSERSVLDALHGRETKADGTVDQVSYNTDYSLGSQREWGALGEAEKAQSLTNFAHQRAIAQEVLSRATQPELGEDGKIVLPTERKERGLVKEGLLYAGNPTLTPELRALEAREFAERESSRSVRLAMALFGARAASAKLDDVQVGKTRTADDGSEEAVTLSGEVLDLAGKSESMKTAKSKQAQLDALSGTMDAYSEKAEKVLIHGQDGLIDQQDKLGALEPGFTRGDGAKAFEKWKEREERFAKKGAQLTKGLAEAGSLFEGENIEFFR